MALQDVVQRFPDTEYARDATLKIDLTIDHLAGKEMAVGRYYLHQRRLYRRHQPLPRRGGAVPDHAADRRSAGAPDRGLLRLGLDSEAQTAAAVLGANYPGSGWYRMPTTSCKGRNLKPEEDKRSWISQAFHQVFSRFERRSDARGADHP